MTKNLEQEITEEQFDQIFHIADTLQYTAERNGKLREGYQELESLSNDAPLTLEILYDTTRELGIKQEFVDKAINLYYPTKSQQREILKQNNATPTREVVIESYANKLIPLFEEIEKTVPNKEFRIKEHYWGLIFNEIIDMKFSDKLKAMWKENHPPTCLFNGVPRRLANLTFYSEDDVRIDLYNPLFLQVCGKTLESLKKELETDSEYTYHYNPHI